MSNRERSSAGFSLAELGVAMLVLSFTTITLLAVSVAASRDVATMVSRADAAEEARQIVAEASASLRNARALAFCASPAGAPLDSCSTIEEQEFILAQAWGGGVCWFTPGAVAAQSTGALDSPLTPPGYACLGVDENDELLLLQWAPTETATYTTPAFEADPFETRVIGTVDSSEGDPFEFINVQGEFIDTSTLPPIIQEPLEGEQPGGEQTTTTEAPTTTTTAPGGTGEEPAVDPIDVLRSIAVVQLNVAVTVEGRDDPVSLFMFAAPRGAFFERERSWGL